MKYIVTYDDNEGERWPICVWEASVEPFLYSDDGLWYSKVPVSLKEEMSIDKFEEDYGKLELEPGQKRAMNVVVHWITEEE